MDRDERNEYVNLVTEHLSPEQALEAYGVTIIGKRQSRKGGQEIDCVCPFHRTITMSFSMHSETGRWFCRSAVCGVKGDLLKFIEMIEDCTTHQAYVVLCELADIEPVEVNPLTVMLSSLDSIGKRKLTSEEQFTQEILPWPMNFKVLPHPYMVKKRRIAPEILKHAMGGAILNDPFYQYRACIPLKQKGNLYSIYSRATATEKAWKKAHPQEAHFSQKYFPKHHYKGNTLTSRLLFGIDDVLLLGTKTVIVVEAIISVLRLRTMGIFNAVAMLKASLSQAQINLLIEDFDQVIICNDNDLREDLDTGKMFNPGMRAAWGNYRKLKDYVEAGVMTMPSEVDPADLDKVEEWLEIYRHITWNQNDVQARLAIKEMMG